MTKLTKAENTMKKRAANLPPDYYVKRKYNVSTACGSPLPMTLTLSDADLDKMNKEFKKSERKNARARARRAAREVRK